EDGLRYIADADGQSVRAVDADGSTVATYDLSGLGIADLRGMDFGPTTDSTDAADEQSLFIADAGDSSTLGRIVEVSFESQAAPPEAVSATATLVRTWDTGGTGPWSPTSPDPSGITYNATSDRI